MRSNVRWTVKRSRSYKGQWVAYRTVNVKATPGSASYFESWDAAMLFVGIMVGYPCQTCKHRQHYDTCGYPKTEEIRVGAGTFDPIGRFYQSVLIGICQCNGPAHE